MKVERFPIMGLVVVAPVILHDSRGSFSETYLRGRFHEIGIDAEFVQENRSVSRKPGTVRGLHFQAPPMAQGKLVSVQHGRIFDVAVDIRRGSPTFGRHLAIELSAERGEQFFIPPGFAHGFCTLEPDTVVTYKLDNLYSPSHERGFHWLTPEFGIAWPCPPEAAILSDRDAALPGRLDPEICFA